MKNSYALSLKMLQPSSEINLHIITLALLSGMSEFGIVLEHTGTSSEIKVQRRHIAA